MCARSCVDEYECVCCARVQMHARRGACVGTSSAPLVHLQLAVSAASACFALCMTKCRRSHAGADRFFVLQGCMCKYMVAWL